jgi:hypothetical protein
METKIHLPPLPATASKGLPSLPRPPSSPCRDELGGGGSDPRRSYPPGTSTGTASGGRGDGVELGVGRRRGARQRWRVWGSRAERPDVGGGAVGRE